MWGTKLASSPPAGPSSYERMLRARFEAHRPVDARVQDYLQALREKKEHSKREAVGAAFLGAGLATPIMDVVQARSNADLRKRFSQLAPLTDSELEVLVEHGVLPANIQAQRQKARAVSDLMQQVAGSKNQPATEALRTVLEPSMGDIANRLEHHRGVSGAAKALRQFGELSPGRATLRPELRKFIERYTARGITTAALPLLLGAGAGVLAARRKYKHLKQPPAEVAKYLQSGDLQRYALSSAFQDVIFPSYALGAAGNQVSSSMALVGR